MCRSSSRSHASPYLSGSALTFHAHQAVGIFRMIRCRLFRTKRSHLPSRHSATAHSSLTRHLFSSPGDLHCGDNFVPHDVEFNKTTIPSALRACLMSNLQSPQGHQEKLRSDQDDEARDTHAIRKRDDSANMAHLSEKPNFYEHSEDVRSHNPTKSTASITEKALDLEASTPSPQSKQLKPRHHQSNNSLFQWALTWRSEIYSCILSLLCVVGKFPGMKRACIFAKELLAKPCL